MNRSMGKLVPQRSELLNNLIDLFKFISQIIIPVADHLSSSVTVAQIRQHSKSRADAFYRD